MPKNCNHFFAPTTLIAGVFLFFLLFLLSLPFSVNAAPLPSKAYRTEEVAPRVKVQRPLHPVMTVRIGEALDPTVFTAEGSYIVENTQGEVLFTVLAGEEVRVQYVDNTYVVQYAKEKKVSSSPVLITPRRLSKVVEIPHFENRPAWDQSLNDNIFYGSVEFVYSSLSQQVLLVNHIPLERYIRGIAEVSNTHHLEHIKTLLTAARTYALYNITHPTKHAGEPYILDATEGDQVYRGAGFTRRSPFVEQAQRETARQVITYDGALIIAAYFSHSDGRTRAWSEVWNGSYPWAVSVEDPCCTGQALLGHGVGLSGEGSRYFAEQGWKWKKILKYYYHGVRIEAGY